MLFLKKKSLGIKKKNIIFIENFLDPVSKKEILSKGYKCELFKVYDINNKIAKDLDESEKIFKNFLKQLNLHYFKKGIKVNPKAFSLITSKWFFYFISQIIYKYRILLKIKKKYPDLALIEIKDKNIDQDEKYLIQPNSTILLFKLFKDIGDDLNIRFIEIKFSQIEKILFLRESYKAKINSFSFKNLFKIIVSKISIIVSKSFHRSTIMIHDDTLNFLDTARLVFKSNFKFSYLFFLENTTLDEDFSVKKSPPSFMSTKNPFERIFYKNLLNYLPLNIISLFTFLENYYSIKKETKKKDVIISKRLFGRDYFKFKKFVIKDFQNLILISYQHGGLYGQEKDLIPETAEKLSSHYFASWGWKGKNIIPLTKNYWSIADTKKKEYCLFVTWSPTVTFLSYYNNPEAIPSFSMHPTLQVMKKISERIPTILRLPPHHNSWRDKEYYRNIKNIKFDNHYKNFEKMAGEAKLVILNHLNTAALECLSMNIPTLIFCDKRFIEYNNLARSNLKKLIKAKIFFHNHKDLIKFLKKNNFNLQKWWSNKKTQNARKSFCDNYCVSKSNFLDDWRYQLDKIK